MLNEQTIYKPIISPVLQSMQQVEDNYFRDLQLAQPVEEVISEESLEDMADKLIEQLPEMFEDITEEMDRFEKPEVDQEPVNKTQIAAIIQRQPNPRKDVEIITPGAGEQKLNF